MNAALVVIGALLIGYSLIAARLESSVVTGPMLFTAAGFLIGPRALDLIDLSLDDAGLETLLTVTLALVLFVDASRIDVRALRRDWSAPARLLGISFPVMLVLGFAVGVVVFPRLDLFAVAAIATILAPTDAALGQAVMANERVPLAVRQTLSVESGLNDGLALPVLLAVIALAEADGAADPMAVIVDELVKEVGGGVLAGVAAGLVGGWAIRRVAGSATRPAASWVSLGSVGVVAVAGGTAEMLHGSVLIASFVAGLVVAPALGSFEESVHEFPEELITLLSLVAFAVFGGVILGSELGRLDWRVGLYAMLTLVALRPISIAIGAAWSGAAPPTVVFIGWFGPRGLASILFVAIVLRKSPDFVGLDAVSTVMTWTVLASIVLHGVTAWPGSNIYGRWADAHPDRFVTTGPPGARPTGDASRSRPSRS